MKKSLLILFAIIFAISLNTQAEDFSAIYNGKTIYYNITSSTYPRTVEVTYRGAYAQSFFDEYSGAISIPDSVLYSGNYYKVTSIGSSAFQYCTSLTSITISNSVTSIGSSAFQYCSGLTSITIPNSVTSIGYQAFTGCSGLTSISIPNSVISIGDNAFQNCSGLTSITIPNSVTSIGSGAFHGCSGLTSITIPNSVTSIGNSAFEDCYRLTSITSKAINPPAVQWNSFSGVSKTIPFYVPCNSIPSYNSAMYWSEFTNKIGVRMPQFITSSICDGSIYTNYGANIDSAGVYTFVNGCDSVILNLIVNPIYNDTILAEICSNETYTLNGFNVNTAGFYTQNLQTIKGCDSIVNLNLIVNPTYNDTILAEICSNETYTLNGFNVNTAGFYTQNLQTIKGCDSVVNLNLIVNPTYLTNHFDTICKGQLYNNYGFNFTSDTSGFYTQNLQTTKGCDSIVNLNLIVNPTPNMPSSLIINQMPNNFEITWQSNGSSYIIYRNNDSLATTTMPIYLDYNVVNGQPYCYKVKAINGDCESEFSNVVCKSYVGLNDISSNNITTKLYPNPTNNKSKLEVDGLKSDADIIVSDLLGRVIKSYKINPTNNELEIDVSSFDKGIYNIRIMNDSINQTKKLIVQ